MDARDISALMAGIAPALRDLVDGSVSPLLERIAVLERDLSDTRAIDHGQVINAAVAETVGSIRIPADGKDADPELIRKMVDEAVGQLPPATPGKDADPELTRQMIADAVSALPPTIDGKDADPEITAALVREEVARVFEAMPKPQDGKSVTVEELVPLINELLPAAVSEAVAGIPAPMDGKDADPEVTAEMIRAEVERVVSELPPAEPGKSVTIEELVPLVAETVSKAVAELPKPKDGEPGKPGKFPIVKAWTDDVTHEGEVRTHVGSTWQAIKDTGKEPPHADWICIAAGGAPGKDADEIDLKTTYNPESAYKRLNIVALNGGAFMARKDNPGPCPGEDWQVIGMRGKPGEPGKKGDPGPKVKGDPGAPVVAADIDEQGLLTLVNGDGTTVECDLYPVLAKVR